MDVWSSSCDRPRSLSRYSYSTCIYHSYSTCMYYSYSTCMYYNYSTCMYYSYSTGNLLCLALLCTAVLCFGLLCFALLCFALRMPPNTFLHLWTRSQPGRLEDPCLGTFPEDLKTVDEATDSLLGQKPFEQR